MIDTLKYSEALTANGFTVEQARGAAKALAEALHTEIASKADLLEVKAELKKDIADIRLEMKELKVSVIQWMAGLAIAQVGLTVSLIKLLH